jgi:hypothetical protein
MQRYQDLKFATAIHVSAYSTIIKCAETRMGKGVLLSLPRSRNRCFYIYTGFSNEINVDNPTHII